MKAIQELFKGSNCIILCPTISCRGEFYDRWVSKFAERIDCGDTRFFGFEDGIDVTLLFFFQAHVYDRIDYFRRCKNNEEGFPKPSKP